MSVPVAQKIYARWLHWGTHIALAALGGCFLAYALELVEPLVALEQLPRVWGEPVGRYLALTGAPSGWAWLGHLERSDYLNYAAIAVLALLTVACYARVTLAFLAAGERAQALLAFAQVLVLLAAASGLLAGGH